MTARIRPYREADRDGAIALWEACGLDAWYNEPDRDIALWVESEGAEILIAEAFERVVGTLCVGHDGHRGWLYYLAVDPELRGKGLGRRLVAEAESWLLARKVRKIMAMVRRSNERAWGFYEALGFSESQVAVAERWLVDRGEPPPGARLPEPKPKAEPKPKTEPLEVTITYLEMSERPTRPAIPVPAGQRLAILRAERPSLAFYRFLYDTVGGPWQWTDRKVLDDEALERIVQDEAVEIYVLYVEGCPAGYFELDRRREAVSGTLEVAYFGLVPEYIGRALGPYLLSWGIERAWSYPACRRLLVNTCTLDHPKALALYQRHGFRVVDRKTVTAPAPR